MTGPRGPGPRRDRWRRLGPVLAIAIAIGTLWWQVTDDGTADQDEGTITAVAVTSDAPRYRSLPQLVAASDLVVRARVDDTQHGRVFGAPDEAAAIESRVVTLRVSRVLRGAGVANGGHLVAEEEGWTLDGVPLVVDGARASQPGDDAIWFLLRVGSGEELRHVVVNAQGRYLVEGDGLSGAAGEDPLVAALEALGPDGLEAAIAALP